MIMDRGVSATVFCLTIICDDGALAVRPSDLVGSRLFQAFVQTHVGKMSGKGAL